MKKIITVALVLVIAIAMCAIPTVAIPQDNGQIANGAIVNSNDVYQNVQNNNNQVYETQKASANVKGNHDITTVVNSVSTSTSSISGSSSVVNNFFTSESNGVYNLDTGVIEMDRVLKSNQVLVLPIKKFGNNQTNYEIVSATPIAVWTIDGSTFSTAGVKALQSKFDYDQVFDVMNHGTIVPVDIVPYFTTKCTINPSSNAVYLVLDNRYYPEDAVTEILYGDSGVPYPVVSSFPASAVIGTTSVFPTDMHGHIITN